MIFAELPDGSFVRRDKVVAIEVCYSEEGSWWVEIFVKGKRKGIYIEAKDEATARAIAKKEMERLR